jgi:hypothetical protein
MFATTHLGTLANFYISMLNQFSKELIASQKFSNVYVYI